MKKFLTVLLVIAVMFTFSFGSAFAGVASADQASQIKAACAYAQSTTDAAIEQAYNAVLSASTNNVDYITAAAWAAAKDDIVKDINDQIQDAADAYLADASTLPSGWDAYPSDMNYTASKLFSDYKSYTVWAGLLNADDDPYAVIAAKAQFAIDYADAVSAYSKIDLDTLYSKTTPTTGDTYYEQAEAAIEDSLAALKAIFFDDEGDVRDWYTKVSEYEAWVSSVTARVDGSIAVTNVTPVEAIKWEGTEVVKYYRLKSATILTKDAEAVEDAATAATTAALKAQIASNIANYAKDAAYDKDFAGTYADVFNFLAEQIPDNATLATKVADQAVAATLIAYKGTNGDALDTAISTIENLEKAAAKYAAEKDATGAYVRDADAIAKLVAKAKLSEYSAAALGTANDYPAATAENAILRMNLASSADKLAFDKEAKKSDLADELDGLADTYYDLEYADVKAAYEAAYAKIDAAESTDDFGSIVTALNKAVDKIKTAGEVNALFTGTSKMATELTNQVTALGNYLTYANTGKVAYEDAYIQKDTADLTTLLRDYYIENNARTLAEMQALTGAVEAVAAEIPTTAALTAAQTAAKDAVKALPAKITSADEAAVINAYEKIAAYNELLAVAGKPASGMTVATQATAVKNALQDDFKLAYAKADKTDKAAMKAIAADIAAANEALADVFDAYTVADIQVPGVETALEKIRTAEYNAVLAAINAIPINVTEADKATVQKARELYDAYVAEYTNYDLGAPADLGYVADDFNPFYSELVAAEATLGLNAPDPEENAKAYVQDLSIKARSEKTSKGVKVTIKADVQQLLDDGFTVEYRFYRSTKSNKNFGKPMIVKSTNTYTNTKGVKGTRYYYKAKIVVKNAAGEVVATTPLTQCLYATRVF